MSDTTALEDLKAYCAEHDLSEPIVERISDVPGQPMVQITVGERRELHPVIAMMLPLEELYERAEEATASYVLQLLQEIEAGNIEPSYVTPEIESAEIPVPKEEDSVLMPGDIYTDQPVESTIVASSEGVSAPVTADDVEPAAAPPALSEVTEPNAVSETATDA